MTQAESGHDTELDPHRRIAQQGIRASERTEGGRRAVGEAQRSAAASFERSADHHDWAATIYEKAARDGNRPDENWQHAARHHEFAQEDRQIAQQLRQMAVRDSTSDPA